MFSLHGSKFLDLCTGATTVTIVAPYIKTDALIKTLDVIKPDAQLTCVTQWTPHDLTSGASDADCRSIIKGVGGRFLLHSSLHAKYYRFDDAVLVGSANLTSSAMGWTPQPNFEILCHPGDDFDVAEFESELLKDARQITDEEFLQWKSLEKISERNDNTSILYPRIDNWKPATRDPRHILMSYQGQENEIASFDEQRATRLDLRELVIPPGLTNEEIQVWMSTCLLAASFTNSVIKLIDNPDVTASYQFLANKYGLGLTEARRDMETVQNWLVYFVPEILSESI